MSFGPIFLYVVTTAIWGTTWFAIKLQLGEVAPEISIVYRFIMASALLLTFCVIRGHRLPLKLSQQLPLMITGFFLFSSYHLMIYNSTRFIVSGLVAVTISMTSLFNIMNGYLFLKRKSDPYVISGALLGVAGIILIFWHEIFSASLQEQTLIGIGLGLAGAFFFSSGNLIARRNHDRGFDLFSSMAVSMTYGMLCTLIYILVTGTPFALPSQPIYWVSLLYLVIPGTLIAFWSYLSLIQQIGPERAGYATIFFPIIAIFISHYAEGYAWSAFDLAGLTLVLSGNCLILRHQKSKAVHKHPIPTKSSAIV